MLGKNLARISIATGAITVTFIDLVAYVSPVHGDSNKILIILKL